MQLVELNEKEYREFTENNNAHFLQSYEWGEVAKTRAFTPYHVGLKDNDKIVAAALLLKKNLVMGYSYFYIPRGFTIDYKNTELLKTFTKEVAKYAKSKKALYFRIDPDIKLHTIDLDGNVVEGETNYDLSDNLVKMGFKRKPLNYFFENEQPRFTFRIDLEDDMDKIESRYSRTTKTRIKQAVNSAVEVSIGTQEDIKEFVRLMEITEKRQDFFSHKKSFYDDFYKIFAKNDMVSLYLGKVNIPKLKEKLNADLEEHQKMIADLADGTSKKAVNRKKELEKKVVALEKQIDNLKDKPDEEIVVSTYLIVRYNDKAWALYAANDMDYGKFFANYLVYREQIRDAKNEGRKIFDVFGTIGKPDSDSKLSGLYEFKKKWGGEYTEFIGEFDYILNKPVYLAYSKLIPIRHKIVNKRLRKGDK